MFLFKMVTNFENRYLFGNRKSAGIRICHWNKGGSHLKNKMQEVRNIVGEVHPHILGLSEANFIKDHDHNLVQIQDYDLHLPLSHADPDLNCSRIVAYTHKSLVAKLRSDLMSSEFSSIWLEVGLPRQKKFLVCQIYREWQLVNSNLENSSNRVDHQLSRWLVFLDQWEKALSTGLEVHVVGDVNLDHCNWTLQNLPPSSQTRKLRPLIHEIFTRILPEGVSQCVVGPTRFWADQSPSGLDHYYTNRPEKLRKIETLAKGGSDHMFILAVRSTKAIITKPRYVRKRIYRNFDPNEFKEAVQQISWLDIYLSEEVNHAVDLLSKKISFILDSMAPLKTIQIRTNYNPWISDSTKDLIKQRDALHQMAILSGQAEDWNNYKIIRNRVVSRQKSEGKSGQKIKLSECGQNSAKIWQNVKNILNWSTEASPSKLFYEGNMYTKSEEVASVQNKFFLEKVRKIKSNLPMPTIDPLSKLKSLMTSRTCHLKLKPVHPDYIDKVIDNLKNSSSFGLDCIDTRIIKLIKPEILPALTHVINLSICSQTFPASWKQAKIIPLFKKGDYFDPKNYRPVAILPIFSKILERAVFDQIIEYMNNNDLLHPCHHAYRKNRNTTTALVQMYDSWINNFDRGEYSAVCFLDMSAAFDIVDHSLLLEKLKLYGFNQESLSWLDSYLSGRSQSVLIGASLSGLLAVPTGVPQGSILGPLLYTIFTNELPETIHDHANQDKWPPFNMSCHKCGTICCFADDTTFSCGDTTTEHLSDKVSEKFKNISDFLTSSGLKLNEEKTHLLLLSSSQRRKINNPQISLATPNTMIQSTSAEQLLGCTIHQDLKWSDYVLNGGNSLVKNLSKRINALKMISPVANFKTRKMVAEGIFMSKLIYLIQVWGGCEAYLLKVLQSLQNKAARSVTKLGWNVSTEMLLGQCGWLSVKQLVFYHSVSLVHNVLMTGVPEYIYELYQEENSQQHNTRLAEKSHVRLKDTRVPKTELALKSFKWRALQQYNELPLEVRTLNQKENFKYSAKKWISANVSLI